MTDKVQKIKNWISKEQDGLIDAQGNFEYPEHEGAYHILCNLDTYIDSLQEEPVSEVILEETNFNKSWYAHPELAFEAGAKLQKEQMMAKAVDAQCFGFQGDALFSFRLPSSNYLVGSEVKVIVIKED